MDNTKEENKKKTKNTPKDLQDTQSKVDIRNIPISRVGIKNINYPFKITDRDNETQSTIGKFTMSVGLSPYLKGTHIS